MRVRAPELPQNQPWLNCSRPLSLQQLRGKVVILDFWTYCCINCLHVLPDLKYLEQKYQQSLVIIGVHSAKFDHEKETENIRQAILRYDIEHPVVVDSSFDVWQQYAVRAWPTIAIIDPQGYVISYVTGEGHRDKLDKIVARLIQEHQDQQTITTSEIELLLEKQHQPLVTPLAFPGKVLATKTHLFISDSGHHRIVVSSLAGEVFDIIGTGKPGFIDDSFEKSRFSSPQGMTYDPEDQCLYVADTENHAIRRIDFQRRIVKTIAGTGEQSHNVRPHDGLASKTALNSPWDIEKIGDSLFIAMAGSHQIWQLQLKTNAIATYAGRGAEACIDGALLEAGFAQPSGITTNKNELYIADSEVSSVRGVALDQLRVRTICGSGDLFGFGDLDAIGSQARLQHCLGIEYFQARLWVTDTYNHKIKCIDFCTGSCQTIFGSGMAGYEDGKGTNAVFFEPSGLSGIDSFLYIADTNNHVIRRADINTLEVVTIQFPQLCAPDFCVPV